MSWEMHVHPRVQIPPGPPHFLSESFFTHAGYSESANEGDSPSATAINMIEGGISGSFDGGYGYYGNLDSYNNLFEYGWGVLTSIR
jgi:hypothetical protein